MSENVSALYFLHMLERVERIQAYTASGKDLFFSDRMIQDAAIWNFEVIGDASKRIPELEKQQASETISWSRMAEFRDILIRQYDNIDLNCVWNIIERDLEPLRQALETYFEGRGGRPQPSSEGCTNNLVDQAASTDC